MRTLIGILILLAIVLAGCSKRIVPTITVHDTVSHSVVITRHDTAIVTKSDSAYYYALIECEKNNAGIWQPVIHNQSVNPGKIIHINANMNGNALTVDCKTDSLKNVITLLEKTITDFRSKTSVEIKPVKYFPWYVKIALWWTGGTLLLLILFIVYKAAKWKFLPI